MLLLRLKNIHKRHLLWAKLIGTCLFLHLVFFFWVFCIYKDNSYMLSLSIHKNMDYSNPIFFVPLGTATTKQPVATVQPVTPKKTPTPPAQKTIEKKQPTSIASKPNNQTSKPKIEPQKPQTVTPPTTPKKIEPPKPEIPKQEVKKIEPKKASADADVKKPDVKPTPVAQALDTNQTIVPVIPENAQISHNYREVEALRKQAQLQKEIVQKWNPPIGVSPNCMCEISFFVTQKGKIEDIKIIKSSGVMMFDISVRQAIFAMKMPQWTYGKPFTINFKQ